MIKNLKSFVPFWNFFSGLPTKHQVGYVILVVVFILIFIFYTIYCSKLQYEVRFEIRSNFDNTIIQKPVTIILNHIRKRRPFDTSNGRYVNRYFPGEYTLGVKPEQTYKIAEPQKITVNKYSEEISGPEVIYLNVLPPFSNPNDSDTERIEPSAPKLVQTAPEEITLYTIIKSLQSSVNRPLEGLTIGNFSVLERYRRATKEAEVLGLKSLQASSLNVVLVIDVSGSMASHIEQAQAAIKKFIQEIQNIGDRDNRSGRISVLLVRGESISLNSFLRLPSSGQSIWFSFEDQNLEQIVNSLSKVGAKGNTPLYDAIDLAVKQLIKLDESSYNVIICLSDGEDNRSKKSIKDILPVIQKSQVPVFSVAYSNTAQTSLKLRQLIDISRESGAGDENIGGFINTNIDQLGDLFSRIASSIEKTYELRWRTEANMHPNNSIIVINEIQEVERATNAHFSILLQILACLSSKQHLALY